jgi:hypothetical protein
MSLPACHSRRRIAQTNQVFFCAHPLVRVPNSLVTPETCQACDYWRQPPPSSFRPVVLGRSRGPCLHLGEQTGLRECVTCQGKVSLKVFACAHPAHRETTLGECHSCPDHEPPDASAGITA